VRDVIPLAELQHSDPSAKSTAERLVKRGLLTREAVDAEDALIEGGLVITGVPPQLTEPQAQVVKEVQAALKAQKFSAFLLHGVTGSGKTEIYMRLTVAVLEMGLSVLILVPEIALTPQLTRVFRERLGTSIAVLHSSIDLRERQRAWKQLRDGKVRVVIGARSAVFAPMMNLGLIVVDEEHDSSFKQEEGVRYHGRDAALLRAHHAGAVCVLGSATPSLETYHRCVQGKLKLLELRQRVHQQPLPRVELVDLRRELNGPSGHRWITASLYRALEDCFSRSEQAIIMINRRGFAQSLACEGCGLTVQCLACSVALTEHRLSGQLRCHYCGFQMPVPVACSTCGSSAWTRTGLGTEQIQEALAEAFPAARVARLDSDIADHKGVEKILSAFRQHQSDVLVGTQMVAKGHDIPNVTLVGVLYAEQTLALPDFRAGERTFQLLTQVAGRAGRDGRTGRVIIQTFQPENAVIEASRRHDYRGFYTRESYLRQELNYPPYHHLAMVRVSAADAALALKVAGHLAKRVRQVTALVRVLGPAPAPVFKVRARYRYRVLLFAEQRKTLRAAAHEVQAQIEAGIRPARAAVDIDPISML